MHSSYLFTNATGVGMKPLEGITYIPDPSFFRPDLIVTDVVYAPHETAMLKMARHAGCKNNERTGHDALPGNCSYRTDPRQACGQ